MANAGANIEALLSLDVSKFEAGIDNAIKMVEKLETSIKSIDTSSKSFTKLGEAAEKSTTDLTKLEEMVKNIDTSLSTLGSSVGKISSSFEKLTTPLSSVEKQIMRYKELLNEVNAMQIAPTQSSLSQLSYLGTNLDSIQSKMSQVTTTSNTTSNSLKGLSSTTNEVSSSINKTSESFNKSSTSAKNATTTYNQMGKALSSLKMVARTVASLFAYDVVLSLAQSVRGTVQQKSEMQAFQQTMGMTSTEVNEFNSSLDKTIARFGKISKYNLGETVASLGVEFSLTNKQMQQAMNITAMLQSEYVRAGRTADEATLAVKDILQGEFVRLSRETGVGKGELVAAGWSGDNTDIATLMDALEKVAKSRHWDTFAAKATSLSDVLQITRARITEFAADLLDSFTPTVVEAFNLVTTVLDNASNLFSSFANSVGNSLGFLDNIYTKLTVASMGVGVFVAALINYRTGMGLIEMAQVGLTKSITATILGIEAENVAMLSSTQMITMKITGYQAETIAIRGSLTALKARILGLNELILKENGYKAALLAKLGYEKISIANTNAQAVAEKALAMGIVMNTNALKSYNLENVSTIRLLIAKLSGVEANTIASIEAATAEEAVTVATVKHLASTRLLVPQKLADIVATKSGTVANIAYAASVTLALAPIIALTAAIAALTIVLVQQYMATKQAADQMKNFNNIVNDGDNIIKSSKRTRDGYREQISDIHKKLSQTTSLSERKQLIMELGEAESHLATAEMQVATSTEAVERARSAQQHYDSRKAEIQIEQYEQLNQILKDVNFTTEEANQISNSYFRDAIDGANQLREALDSIKLQSKKSAQAVAHNSQQLFDVGASKEEIEESAKNTLKAQDMIIKGREKAMTDESSMGRLDGWLTMQEGQLRNWWEDFRVDANTWDLTGVFDHLTDIPSLKVFKDIGKGASSTIYDSLKSANDDIEKWSDDTKQSLQDAWKGFSDWGSSGIQWIKGGAGDIWNGVTDFFKPLTDWLDYLPHANISEMIMEALPDIDLGAMLGDWLGGAKKSDGGGIEWIKGLMNDYLIKPASEWINGFIADPLSYLGIEMDTSFINTIIQSLTGVTDVFEDISNYFNENFITPISEWINGFIADPLSYLGAVGVDVGLIQLILNMLTGEVDPIAFMTEWVNSHIVQPLTTILQNLPQFISGLIDGLFNNTGNSENADNAGYKLGKSFGDGILRAIGEIPIVGDILRMLGLIPSTNPDANSKGKGVGDNVVMGYFKGTAKLVTDAVQEFTDIANGIAKKAHEAFAAAKGWAEQAWAGLNSIFQRHSPGFFYKSVKDEFEQMSNTINEQSSEAYSSAQTYGQSVYDGVVPFMEAMSNQIDQNMVTLDENINSEAIAQYKTDANTAEQIATSTVADSQMAFDGLGSNVGTVLTDMSGKLVSTYTGMNADQTSLLNNMKNNNNNAYKTMQTQTTSSLTNMRNSTQTVTNQMTSAWILMKNNIVTAANQLKTQSNSHFNQLSSTIGSFYRKLQNPANWGGSPNEITVSGKPSNLNKGASAMRKIISQPTSRFAGGKAAGTPFPNTTTISIKELLKMFGDDNKILSRKINLGELLGDDFLFGNWSDWYPKHYNQIKQTTGNWDMKGPALLNYIDTGMAFKVKEFENGSPNVSWNSFKQMGEALFSAIPYDFYYNHDKTGDWVSALYTGSVNCVDGNEALLALANTCGFSGHLAHGTWNGVAHVYAVINGQKMDATGWQQRRSWAGVAAGSPSKSSYAKLGSEETTNITIDLREATIYGVDDLERTIENAVQKGLQKEINVSTITGV